MSILVDSISVPFHTSSHRSSIEIESVVWSTKPPTVVTVRSFETGEQVKINFKDDCGLRILNEVDLAGWWMNAKGSPLSESWLFEIKEGGWLESESKRSDFSLRYSKEKIREFLITSESECVSILTLSEPKITT